MVAIIPDDVVYADIIVVYMMMHLEVYNLLLAYLLFGWFPTKICQLDRSSVAISYFTYLILRKNKR